MFRKIFSDIWLCSWKYHRKLIFYLLLTFSHIFSVTKRIHNIIHSSNHKQSPEKSHQIRTNEGEISISIADRDRAKRRSRLRSKFHAFAIAINADRHVVWIGLSLSRCVWSCVLGVLVECVSLTATEIVWR